MKYAEYREKINADKQCWRKMRVLIPGWKVIREKRRCEFLKNKKWLYVVYCISRLKYRHLCIKYGMDIPSQAKIGKGFSIFHFGGIVINSDAVIGEYVEIRPNVMIGGTEKGAPSIGNHVKIGVGACIIGKISVGDYAEIGAGGVVVKDVPQNAVVAGNPAKIIRIKDNR